MVATNDFLLDESGLQVYKGDFLTGDATLQHQKHLLLTAKGGAKNHPLVGVGLQEYLNDDIKPYILEGAIALEFEKDGMKVDQIKIETAENATIIASYAD